MSIHEHFADSFLHSIIVGRSLVSRQTQRFSSEDMRCFIKSCGQLFKVKLLEVFLFVRTYSADRICNGGNRTVARKHWNKRRWSVECFLVASNVGVMAADTYVTRRQRVAYIADRIVSYVIHGTLNWCHTVTRAFLREQNSFALR